MNQLELTFFILGIIFLVVGLITLFFIFFVQWKKIKLFKKIEVLTEELNQKSKILNPFIENISKCENYIDVINLSKKENFKNVAKALNQNKDEFYEIANKFKKNFLGTNKNNNNKKITKEIK